jgi:hypothetical protein
MHWDLPIVSGAVLLSFSYLVCFWLNSGVFQLGSAHQPPVDLRSFPGCFSLARLTNHLLSYELVFALDFVEMEVAVLHFILLFQIILICLFSSHSAFGPSFVVFRVMVAPAPLRHLIRIRRSQRFESCNRQTHPGGALLGLLADHSRDTQPP